MDECEFERNKRLFATLLSFEEDGSCIFSIIKVAKNEDDK